VATAGTVARCTLLSNRATDWAGDRSRQEDAAAGGPGPGVHGLMTGSKTETSSAEGGPSHPRSSLHGRRRPDRGPCGWQPQARGPGAHFCLTEPPTGLETDHVREKQQPQARRPGVHGQKTGTKTENLSAGGEQTLQARGPGELDPKPWKHVATTQRSVKMHG